MKFIAGLGLLLLIAGGSLVQAQKKTEVPAKTVVKTAQVQTSSAQAGKPEANPNLAALLHESAAFTKAFNKHDAQAVAALWTAEGEYVDEAGQRLTGREEIQKSYAEFFEANPKATIRTVQDSIRLLSENSAIEEGRAMVEPVSAGSSGVSQYTVFHTKVDGEWKMASVRDTAIEAPVAHQHLSDLDWLIGRWVAEEHGVKLESVYRWIANKTFVERRYRATHLDGSHSEGLQIIGWNPYAGHIQSWDFSPDGGNAAGVWSPTPEGWTAETQGVAGDGSITSAVNHLLRLDDNAYVWRSTDRARSGVALPEADEVVIRRVISAE